MSQLSLSDFQKNNNTTDKKVFDRTTQPHTFVVDTHLHFKPFGGEPIAFDTLVKWLHQNGVVFANVYGIGQILPSTSKCTYYLDCPGTHIMASTQNDLQNAKDYLESQYKDDVHLTLSMSFPDLAHPHSVADTMKEFDSQYPDMFKWMGEVNLIKQALLDNGHTPSTKKNIEAWKGFMGMLQEKNAPINIHCDMGSNESPSKFLELIEYVLELYPDNKIVWAHMGLSKELSCSTHHSETVEAMLNNHKNLMIDISWRVLNDYYFSKAEQREHYVALFNKYSDRVLTGTDFVASKDKTLEIYTEELQVNSNINQYLTDEAFRNIALGQNYFRLMNLDYEAPEVCRS